MQSNFSKNIVIISSIIIFLICTSLGFSQITTPEQYLGYKPGDDFHLATYEQLTGYFDVLADETNRLKMFDMGPTTEGRRMRYAIISSEANMANLDKYKNIVRKLSLAKTISDEEAKKLADAGKVVVWIDSGIHSTETSPPMHQFLLAYHLINSTEPMIEKIREKVIFLLVLANPDGMTLVADWYKKNLGTKYEVSRIPVLYNKYAGHDNNRDFHVANLLETQNINKLVCTEWFPCLMYAQHETAPFPARIWMPPNADPVHPNTHPLVFRWKNMMGSAMGRAFDAAEQPGAMSRNGFDLWYPGYEGGPSFESHNIPTALTETANYRYATPHYYTINDFPENYRDLVKGTFYPSPWEGGWWRISDAIEYNLTASLSILDLAARFSSELLYSKYQTGRDIIEKFNVEPPFGWIFSPNQSDPGNLNLLINNLLDNGIDVFKSDTAFIHEGISYPQGSYIIPTNQAFGFYVKTILEKQEYPDMRKYPHLWQGVGRQLKWDGAPITPYDGVGWTLPIQFGLKAHQMSTPLEVKKTVVTEKIKPSGAINGSGSHYILSPTENYSYSIAAQVLAEGGKVSRAFSDLISDGNKYGPGAFIIQSNSISKNKIQKIISETNIVVQGGKVRGKLQPVKKPKIGLYKSWAANTDAGWISFIFDKYKIPYQTLTDAEMKAGDLYDRFDTIILPDQRSSSIINGNRKGTMPAQYIGGITNEGVENLREFVENGGTLICNRSSTELAIKQFNLPIKNVLKGVKSDTFNCPGSLIKIRYKKNNPLSFGLKQKNIAYFSHGAAFEIIQDSSKVDSDQVPNKRRTPQIVATYPDESLLLSGWILGENLIRKKAAIVDVPFGKGNIILFGFNFHNRAQTYVNFKLVFNAIFE